MTRCRSSYLLRKSERRRTKISRIQIWPCGVNPTRQ
jgi:hypothetical protein